MKWRSGGRKLLRLSVLLTVGTLGHWYHFLFKRGRTRPSLYFLVRLSRVCFWHSLHWLQKPVRLSREREKKKASLGRMRWHLVHSRPSISPVLSWASSRILVAVRAIFWGILARTRLRIWASVFIMPSSARFFWTMKWLRWATRCSSRNCSSSSKLEFSTRSSRSKQRSRLGELRSL